MVEQRSDMPPMGVQFSPSLPKEGDKELILNRNPYNDGIQRDDIIDIAS